MVADDANGYGSVGSSTGGSNNIRFKVGTDAYFEGGNFGFNNPNPVQPLTVTGNISSSGALQIHDQGSSLAATIRATDTTNGYGLAVESQGTANTRYNVIFRNLDASVIYGGIATKTGQVGFWGVGVSPAQHLEVG